MFGVLARACSGHKENTLELGHNHSYTTLNLFKTLHCTLRWRLLSNMSFSKKNPQLRWLLLPLEPQGVVGGSSVWVPVQGSSPRGSGLGTPRW